MDRWWVILVVCLLPCGVLSGAAAGRRKRSLGVYPSTNQFYKGGVGPAKLLQSTGYGMAGQAPYHLGIGYKDPRWGARYKQWLASSAMFGMNFGNAPPKIGEDEKDNDYMKYLLKNKMYHAYAALRMPGNSFWKQIGYGAYGNAGKGKYTTRGKGKFGKNRRYRRFAKDDDDDHDDDYDDDHNYHGYGISPMSYLNTLAMKGPMFGGFPWFGKFPAYGKFPFGFPYMGSPYFGGFPYGGHFGGHFGGYGKGGYRKKRSLYGGRGRHGRGLNYPWYNFPWTGNMFYSPNLNYGAYNMANLLSKWTSPAKYY